MDNIKTYSQKEILKYTGQLETSENTKTFWLNWLVVFAWVFNCLRHFCVTVLSTIFANDLIADIIIASFFIFLIIFALPEMVNKIQISDIVAFLVLSLIVMISYVGNINNRVNIESNIRELFINVIPFYYVGIVMNKDKKMSDILHFASIVTFFIYMAYIIYYYSTGRVLGMDNMWFAYAILPHVLLIISYSFIKKNIFDILLSILGFVFILSMGTRGPVISMLVLCVFLLIYVNRLKKFKLFLLITLLIAFIVIISVSGVWEKILLWLRDIINQLNLSTRVIDSILYEAGNDSNEERIWIYNTLFESIKGRPITGYGIYGEWAITGHYAHQLFLELWLHYGIFLGSILIIAAIYIIIEAFITNKNMYTKLIIIVMFATAFIRVMYSSTYLSMEFFLLIGICVSARREAKEIK